MVGGFLRKMRKIFFAVQIEVNRDKYFETEINILLKEWGERLF